VAIILFIAYLVTLPYLNELLIPCLKPIPGASYSDNKCYLSLALDRYMMMAFIGFIVFSAIIFIRGKRRAYLTFILFSSVCSILIIVFYLNYIKIAEKQIRNAPIILVENK
jgi:hypothetical protein